MQACVYVSASAHACVSGGGDSCCVFGFACVYGNVFCGGGSGLYCGYRVLFIVSERYACSMSTTRCCLT